MSGRKRVWFEAAGRKLDPGLVEQLRLKRKEDPYETSNDRLPVIVSYSSDTDAKKKKELITACQADNNSRLDKDIGRRIARGNLTPQIIKQIKDHEAVDRIYYDRIVTALLDVASKQVGSVELRENAGLTGKGVTIAVIDTGVHPHSDLTETSNRIVAFKDFFNDQEEPYDDNGHGTHCAGDAAGDGQQSDGLYSGPAPEASIAGVKVLDENGSGRLSGIIEGIEWCIAKKDDYNIRVLSLSLGSQAFESFRDDPLSIAVGEAWHKGIVVCAAAGNSGPEQATISTPAINPFIITVGSIDDQNTEERSDDEIAEYSGRGPTVDAFVKPDIYAPGTDIISLLAPESALEHELPEQVVDENYLQLSGTSMATPICAGVVAQILEANPDLSPNDVKTILKATSKPALNDVWGYIQAGKAVEMAGEYAGFQKAVK
ncbi:serine protease AprX [Lentibacillus persicus]|uniref:Serine protease AprX n=1 Tax=Lentibacillus persicus TaxID=640948 RepID=A0A1I1X1N8_9BACI|nr:S8 family peptidase [Lentibacillus persicus]SFE01141.1 serine protease AprX [Lentibacillus persicus]